MKFRLSTLVSFFSTTMLQKAIHPSWYFDTANGIILLVYFMLLLQMYGSRYQLETITPQRYVIELLAFLKFKCGFNLMLAFRMLKH